MRNAPNIAKSYFLQGTKEAKARQLVEDRLALSVRRFSGQNAVFRELNRYYLSLTPTLRGNANDIPGSSKYSREPDLFVPRPFSIVEGATPMWIFGVLGGHPPIRVLPRKQAYTDRSRGIQSLVTYDFERAQVLYRSMHVAKQQFKYGTGIAKVGYKFDSYDLKKQVDRDIPLGWNRDGSLKWGTSRGTSTEEVVRYDGPWLEPWSVFNFYPDPFYWDIREMRYVCARRWTDRATLEWEDEQYFRHMGRRRFKHLDRIPAIPRSYVEDLYQTDDNDDIGEAMGWSGAYSPIMRHSPGHDGYDRSLDLIEIVEYWDRDDRVVYMANGETPILDTENPYDDKEIPFVATRCHVLDRQFWGYGLLHPIRRSIEELNSLRNLNLRQAQLNILNVWGYDESIGLAQIATNFDPGDVIPIPFFANGNPGLVPLFQGRPLPPEAYQYEDRIDLDIQTAIAMPGYRSGIGDSDGTATEASIEEQRAQDRIKLQNLGGSLTYSAELARFFISRRRQYLKSDGDVIRITGVDGLEFMTYTREDLEGEFDFIPGGQHVYPGKDVLRQQLTQLIPVATQNPVLMQITKWPVLYEELIKLFDFENPTRFIQQAPERNPFAQRPDLESKVLASGDWLEATAMEPHELHIEGHREALSRALATGNERGANAIRAHLRMHETFLQQQQAQAQQQQAGPGGGGMAPPQEQPGLRGYSGNVPNLENSVETSAGIQARLGGAARGGR